MKKFTISFITFCSVFFCVQLWSQDDPVRVYMYLDYYKVDQEQYLLAELKYRKDRVFYQLEDVEVEFKLVDSTEMVLGSAQTSVEGFARLDLSKSQILWDTSGQVTFTATFSGTEGFRKAEKEISIKNLAMSLETQVIDSTYQVLVRAENIKSDAKYPVDGIDINISTQRLYSKLPINSGAAKNGVYESEFPSDLPGDGLGNLKIVAEVIDDDDFGNVAVTKEAAWGLPVSFQLEERPRALWSRAPYWIIFAVSLIFILIWYHYFLALSKLFRIKKL